MMFSGKIQGQKEGKRGQAKDKDSFIELGGHVLINNIKFSFSIHLMYFIIVQHAVQTVARIRTVVGLHQEKHFIDLYEDAFNQDCINFAYGSKTERSHMMQC